MRPVNSSSAIAGIGQKHKQFSIYSEFGDWSLSLSGKKKWGGARRLRLVDKKAPAPLDPVGEQEIR